MTKYVACYVLNVHHQALVVYIPHIDCMVVEYGKFKFNEKEKKEMTVYQFTIYLKFSTSELFIMLYQDEIDTHIFK